MRKTQSQISQIWNCKHKYYDCKSKIVYDDWLDEFCDIVNSSSRPIIDLGCGPGNNTLYLTEKEKEVVACDFSTQAIQIINEHLPNVPTKLFDMTQGLPFLDSSADVIIADLCLHYFDEETTYFVINEIKRVLSPNGHLIFRVNSVNDVNHGALQGETLSHHFFFTDDMSKRFFDEDDLLRFFKGWNSIKYREESMTRYKNKKILWRCCVEKPESI